MAQKSLLLLLISRQHLTAFTVLLTTFCFQSLPNPHPKLSDLPHGAEDRNRYAHVIPSEFVWKLTQISENWA